MILSDGNRSGFEDFIHKAEDIAEGISRAGHEKDAEGVNAIAANFRMKTEDFYRANRKLNIGVVGQVKAGKSSFLNTLLFDGREVLPKASTPKTATLTKMEYAERNSIEIEYYSAEEWETLEKKARVDDDDVIYASARELVEMAERNGIRPEEYTSKGREEIFFDSYDELIAHLNDYVGADGRVTPLVRDVILHLNRPEFEGLSIVDTPGLNDPIVSRTVRTREFMEVCDVVFFLSQAGSFLDKSDWQLLSAQLPQKGVKRLVLIASKYDSGLRDVLRVKDEDDDIFGEDDSSTDSIPEACRMVRGKLTKTAKKKIASFVKELESDGHSSELISVVRQCEKPLMVSAMAYNMSRKAESEYTREEKNLRAGLSPFTKNLQESLELIGNFDEVKRLFAESAREKEEILERKSREFLPTAEGELRSALALYKENAEKRAKMLSENDREQLSAQKAEVEAQMGHIKADVVSVFGELLSKLETERSEGVREIRALSKDYMHINEREGTEVHRGSYTTGHWFWKKRHYYTYETHYSYCMAADAAENLRSYAMEAASQIESVFTDAIELQALKRKLLNVVIQNFDTGSESYNASMFRILVENAVNKINFPDFSLDVSDKVTNLTRMFTGEVRDAEDRNKLSNALHKTLSDVFSVLASELEKKSAVFRGEMETISGQVSEALLKDIEEEFDTLLKQCENKEAEIAGYEAYIALLSEDLKRLS